MPRTVREIMTEAPVQVSTTAYVSDVAARMRDEDIGAVLVTEAGEPRGLVTDRDLAVRVLARGGDVTGIRVREACSSELVSVAPEEPVGGAVELMRGKALRRLPVLDDGRVVGVVSLGDLSVEQEPSSALGDISASTPNT